MEETEPEEGAVKLTEDEENERHSSYSWDLPKSPRVPNQEDNSSLLPCANQNECHERVKHLLSLRPPWPMSIQARVTAVSSHRPGPYALLCCPFERENGRGWEQECQRPPRMGVIVGITVGAPLGSLFSCMKRMPERLRNRF